MSRRGSILRERQERENREKEIEEDRIRREELHQGRLERRINRETRREIIEGNTVISNPVYSPSPLQLRSPLHFTNLIGPREVGELGSFSGLPIPPNSPEEIGQPPPPEVQTPPATTFLSTITSRVKRAVQSILSPPREQPSERYVDGNILSTPVEVEPQNPPNTEELSENLNSIPDTSTRTLFYTPILISPFDESIDTSDGLHAIGRPIGESLRSPPNCILSLPNSRVPRFLNNTNFRRPRIAGQESVDIADPFLQTPNLPVEPTLPTLTITELGEEENFETEVRVNP